MARPARAGDGAARKPVTVRLHGGGEVRLGGGRGRRGADGVGLGARCRGRVRCRSPGRTACAAALRGDAQGWAGRSHHRPIPRLWSSWRRLGNNLNQIARFLNATGGPFSPGGLVALRVIERRIDEVLAGGPSEGAIPAAPVLRRWVGRQASLGGVLSRAHQVLGARHRLGCPGRGLPDR